MHLVTGKTNQKTFFIICLTTCLFILFMWQLFIISHWETNTDISHEVVTTFQSSEPAEFPHIIDGKPKIPHIIHQIYHKTQIPDQMIGFMRSFVQQNPTWVYRFWTYESGLPFLKKHLPFLVGIYESFGRYDVKRSDMLRLAVLYEYGGVYADIDVLNRRSLNITTTKYSCIIPTEPFEHAGLLYNRHFLLSNSVMLCAPKHPYFQMLLLNLQDADPDGHPVKTIGPEYLTSMYIVYSNLSIITSVFNDSRSNSPYFCKGQIDEESAEGVYIPNTQYFSDNVDPDMINKDGELIDCIRNDLIHTLALERRACKEFESRKLLRKDKTFTFTIHYWYHLWTRGSDDWKNDIDIKYVIPNAVLWEKT